MRTLLLSIVMLIASVPAFAQVDLTGVWNPNLTDEDAPEHIAGPSLVEFVGLPINDQARAWGLSYKPSRLSLPEHQCQVHVVEYIHRGPWAMLMWEERDPVTFQLIAIHEFISNYEQNRIIWMDGRPHPSEFAPHTFMGFSTGAWEGNMLTVTTTHVKQGWHGCENIPATAGENIYVSQYAAEHNLPQAVTLGGPESMYPEYREKMKGQPVAVYKDPDAGR